MCLFTSAIRLFDVVLKCQHFFFSNLINLFRNYLFSEIILVMYFLLEQNMHHIKTMSTSRRNIWES